MQKYIHSDLAAVGGGVFPKSNLPHPAVSPSLGFGFLKALLVVYPSSHYLITDRSLGSSFATYNRMANLYYHLCRALVYKPTFVFHFQCLART